MPPDELLVIRVPPEGNPGEPTQALGLDIIVDGAEGRKQCLGNPVPVVRSALMKPGSRRECAHSNVQETCYVSVLGTSRVLISSLAS